MPVSVGSGDGPSVGSTGGGLVGSVDGSVGDGSVAVGEGDAGPEPVPPLHPASSPTDTRTLAVMAAVRTADLP